MKKQRSHITTFRQMALSFSGTAELPHFEKTSFRIHKKIFATLDETNGIACLKFTTDQQHQFCLMSKAIYPVNNSWGKKGWTNIDLNIISEELMAEALETAYKETLKT